MAYFSYLSPDSLVRPMPRTREDVCSLISQLNGGTWGGAPVSAAHVSAAHGDDFSTATLDRVESGRVKRSELSPSAAAAGGRRGDGGHGDRMDVEGEDDDDHGPPPVSEGWCIDLDAMREESRRRTAQLRAASMARAERLCAEEGKKKGGAKKGAAKKGAAKKGGGPKGGGREDEKADRAATAPSVPVHVMHADPFIRERITATVEIPHCDSAVAACLHPDPNRPFVLLRFQPRADGARRCYFPKWWWVFLDHCPTALLPAFRVPSPAGGGALVTKAVMAGVALDPPGQENMEAWLAESNQSVLVVDELLPVPEAELVSSASTRNSKYAQTSAATRWQFVTRSVTPRAWVMNPGSALRGAPSIALKATKLQELFLVDLGTCPDAALLRVSFPESRAKLSARDNTPDDF